MCQGRGDQHKGLTDSGPERGIVGGRLTSSSPSHVAGYTKLHPRQRRRVLFLQPSAVLGMTVKTKPQDNQRRHQEQIVDGCSRAVRRARRK